MPTDDDLYVALNELRNAAGAPSLRQMAKRTGLAHMTVDGMLKGHRARRPKWSNIERLVSALDGNPDDFKAAWIKAEPPPLPLPTMPQYTTREMLAEILAALQRLEDATQLCEKCRETCKTCGAPCRHSCHD